jgi:hypothetical protein
LLVRKASLKIVELKKAVEMLSLALISTEYSIEKWLTEDIHPRKLLREHHNGSSERAAAYAAYRE